jgi:hypothetical protein
VAPVDRGRESRYPLALTREDLADVLDALEHRRDMTELNPRYHAKRAARLRDLEDRVFALKMKAEERELRKRAA